MLFALLRNRRRARELRERREQNRRTREDRRLSRELDRAWRAYDKMLPSYEKWQILSLLTIGRQCRRMTSERASAIADGCERIVQVESRIGGAK